MLRPQNVVDADDVLVAEAQQDLDLAQRALAVGLVLERADLLDGDALVRRVIQGRTGRRGSGREHRAGLRLHAASFTTRISNPWWMQSGKRCIAVWQWTCLGFCKQILHENNVDVGMLQLKTIQKKSRGIWGGATRMVDKQVKTHDATGCFSLTASTSGS